LAERGRELGEVFDPAARPWVDVDAADPDAIAAAVLTCPTGALHFRRRDGGPREEPREEMTIDPRPDGPLFVRGRVRILDADSDVVREDTRVALCRCGASDNKPFCDGSHRPIGFTTGATSCQEPLTSAPSRRSMIKHSQWWVDETSR
jgi:CDGSH-type Zn-finger protein